MSHSQLFVLYFDKGGGALFEVEEGGRRVRCFLPQANTFLIRMAGSAGSFPDLVERYSRLVAAAARINIQRLGASNDPWGNCIEDQDMEIAQTFIRMQPNKSKLRDGSN